MRLLLISVLTLITNLSLANEQCVNLTGVYSKPSHPDFKVTIEQKGCESITANSTITSSVQTLSLDGQLRKANSYCEIQSQYPNYSPGRDVFVSAVANKRMVQFTCAGVLKLNEEHASMDHAATIKTWSLSEKGALVEHSVYSNGGGESRVFTTVFQRQ